jgi:hypothetical protein
MKKARTTMEKSKSGSKEGEQGESPSQLIDARIKELGDWRGETLARIRILIKQADPEVVEEWKWRGVPVQGGHDGRCHERDPLTRRDAVDYLGARPSPWRAGRLRLPVAEDLLETVGAVLGQAGYTQNRNVRSSERSREFGHDGGGHH